ncbi:Uncharacterized protein TPAR_08791 [Tolypocladium paradoxum]|uniref:Uncharacterized protein n=1 Tax=Tolypocladium paradoxum TaxID=94208 RepID=A0A2S4KLE4_9HYPO|nr:Uncharacterized protein TPAR_08791 [Tolypocladium paradoxum]
MAHGDKESRPTRRARLLPVRPDLHPIGQFTIFRELADAASSVAYEGSITILLDDAPIHVETTSHQTILPLIENEKALTDWLAKNDPWAVGLQGPSHVGPLTKGDKVHVKALRTSCDHPMYPSSAALA